MAVSKTIFLAAMAIAVGVSGCASKRELATRFEGQYYPAKASSESAKNRKEFSVKVRESSKGIEGARQAAAYEATKYCIKYFGTSDIEWTVGPDAPEEAILQDGALILQGTCTE